MFVSLVVGCYSLRPAMGETALVPGKQVAFDVTDVGRVALGGQMGPEIDQVEGRFVEAQNGDYVLSVSSVKLLRGGTQVWAGEQVRINKDHVGRVYERRFSPGRTIAFGAAVAAGAYFLIGRDLRVFGQPGDQPPPTDTIIELTLPLRRVRPGLP